MKFLTILLFYSILSFAQSDVPLTLRAQFNGSFGYTIIGNTLNEFDNYQNPPPICQMLTQSSATLNLAPNQNIVAAYLYWGGIGDGTFDPNIQLNGINYTANQTGICYPENNFIVDYFSSFREITSQVILTGNGVYTFSNLDLNPIINNYCSSAVYNGGWHIVIIYNEVGLPNKQLNLYDGVNVVSEYFNNGTTLVPINNLNIVNTQNATMSYVALNGSPNLFFNESIIFNGNTLSNALNPPTNPFNGSNSFTGSTTSWNQDIDTFDISPFINFGDTQANITLNSVFYRLFQTVVTSIRSELPDATVQIDTVTGQTICNNRDLTINYTVFNTNSNSVLPIVPISFYADGVLLQTTNTTSSVAIGGSLNLQVTLSIPISIPDTFTLTVNADNSATNSSTVPESNENNNLATQVIVLTTNNINPNFSLANAYCQNTTVPTLPVISNNFVAGFWLPTAINNLTSGTYVFTPNAGQCATSFTLNVTINLRPTVNVTGNGTICNNQTAIFEFSGTPNAVVTYTLNSGLVQAIALNTAGLATVSVTNIIQAITCSIINVFDSFSGCSLN